MEQITLFDLIYEPIKISKKIRLIELFAGYGSQAMALERMGVDFEHHKVVEIDKYAVQSYNAVHGTNYEPIDITQLKGKDLDITDTDKYCYILFYSFPCTDLSVAGKMLGMEENSGTRSSLLWEVKRLLNETENLPQILIMENVSMIHSEDNMPHFRKWLDFLEEKGYTSYWQDLNAKDYGVAQSRERTFVVSFLGQYNFHFPKGMKLKKVMDDYLDDVVDEKYYLKSQKALDLIQKLVDEGTLNNTESLDRQTDRQTDRQIGELGFIDKGSGKHQSNTVYDKEKISPTLSSSDHKSPIKVIE